REAFGQEPNECGERARLLIEQASAAHASSEAGQQSVCISIAPSRSTNRTQHRPLATRFSVDSAVSSFSYRSWDLWLLGYPEAALSDADQAVSDARQLDQAATLIYALASV